MAEDRTMEAVAEVLWQALDEDGRVNLLLALNEVEMAMDDLRGYPQTERFRRLLNANRRPWMDVENAEAGRRQTVFRTNDRAVPWAALDEGEGSGDAALMLVGSAEALAAFVGMEV